MNDRDMTEEDHVIMNNDITEHCPAPPELGDPAPSLPL